MRQLIRNSATGKFLTRDGEWTDDPLKARAIHSVTEAMALIEEFKLQNAELYSPKAEQPPRSRQSFCDG